MVRCQRGVLKATLQTVSALLKLSTVSTVTDEHMLEVSSIALWSGIEREPVSVFACVDLSITVLI